MGTCPTPEADAHTHTHTHTHTLSLSLSHTHTHTHTRAVALLQRTVEKQWQWIVGSGRRRSVSAAYAPTNASVKSIDDAGRFMVTWVNAGHSYSQRNNRRNKQRSGRERGVKYTIQARVVGCTGW